MKRGRACRYCKSPAWRNPCWWTLIHPNYQRTGADLPCAIDDWCDEQRRASTAWLIKALVVIAVPLVIIGLIYFF